MEEWLIPGLEQEIYKMSQIARNLMKHLEPLSLSYDIIWPPFCEGEHANLTPTRLYPMQEVWEVEGQPFLPSHQEIHLITFGIKGEMTFWKTRLWRVDLPAFSGGDWPLPAPSSPPPMLLLGAPATTSTSSSWISMPQMSQKPRLALPYATNMPMRMTFKPINQNLSIQMHLSLSNELHLVQQQGHLSNHPGAQVIHLQWVSHTRTWAWLFRSYGLFPPRII